MTMEHEPMTDTITIDEEYVKQELVFMELALAAQGTIEAGPD